MFQKCFIREVALKSMLKKKIVNRWWRRSVTQYRMVKALANVLGRASMGQHQGLLRQLGLAADAWLGLNFRITSDSHYPICLFFL